MNTAGWIGVGAASWLGIDVLIIIAFNVYKRFRERKFVVVFMKSRSRSRERGFPFLSTDDLRD